MPVLPAFGREVEFEPIDDEIVRGGRDVEGLFDPLDGVVGDGRFEPTLLRESDGRFLVPPDLFTFDPLLFVGIWIPP